MEMMPPESWAGTEYLVTEFDTAGPHTVAGDRVRIMTLEPAAFVSVEPVPGGTSFVDGPVPCSAHDFFYLANAGQFCDLAIARGARITANPPRKLLVGHFPKSNSDGGSGDPSFVLVSPVNRHTCLQKRFFCFPGFNREPGKNGSFVNIVAPTSVIGWIQLDGQALLTGVTCLNYLTYAYPSPSPYSWARCLLPDPPANGAEHVLTSPTGIVPFAAYAYGQKLYGAYAYPTGIGF